LRKGEEEINKGDGKGEQEKERKNIMMALV
jgi:hypothetical protein